MTIVHTVSKGPRPLVMLGELEAGEEVGVGGSVWEGAAEGGGEDGKGGGGKGWRGEDVWGGERGGATGVEVCEVIVFAVKIQT